MNSGKLSLLIVPFLLGFSSCGTKRTVPEGISPPPRYTIPEEALWLCPELPPLRDPKLYVENHLEVAGLYARCRQNNNQNVDILREIRDAKRER